MTTIDILVATYLGWAFYRGRRRGFRAETARIAGLVLTLAFLLGLGLFSLVKNSLSALADNLLQHRGIVVTVSPPGEARDAVELQATGDAAVKNLDTRARVRHIGLGDI